MDFSKYSWEKQPGSILDLDKFKRSQAGSTYENEESIKRALERKDVDFLRGLSKYYMGVSGIYQRLVEYMSSILTYDWYAYPLANQNGLTVEDVREGMDELLAFLDNSFLTVALSDITKRIIVEGSYYGYFVTNPSKEKGTFLELPNQYCRSRMSVNGLPAVEFNAKYFDEQFMDEQTRELVLKTFPKEFLQNYRKYQAGLIPADPSDRGHWFLLDTDLAMKFNITSDDTPLLAAVIPSLINLEKAKEIDLKKTMQELLKILIQKMPIDKNGELIFDIEESHAMHQGASNMLQNAVNVDILTTFAEIDVADLDSSSTSTIRDPLEKVERGVFNEAGISQHLFATDGNLSLEKSILNDEGLLFKLLDKYQNRLNMVIENLFNSKGSFKISFPHISIFNAERKQSMYQEMATNGYSKLLPAIAAGVSQTEFLSLNKYEEEILGIRDKLIPVQSSNTMSSGDGDSDVGAPAKDEDELAEKTIQNKESQG